jgi:hypothetical protein
VSPEIKKPPKKQMKKLPGRLPVLPQQVLPEVLPEMKKVIEKTQRILSVIPVEGPGEDVSAQEDLEILLEEMLEGSLPELALEGSRNVDDPDSMEDITIGTQVRQGWAWKKSGRDGKRRSR